MNKNDLMKQIEVLLTENKKIYTKYNELEKKSLDLENKSKKISDLLDEAKAKISRLEKSVSDLNDIIALKDNELNDLKIIVDNNSKQDRIPECRDKNNNSSQINENVVISADKILKMSVCDNITYASSIIGQVIRTGTEMCNEFAESGNEQAKDLINLTLGRVEMFKLQTMDLVEEYKNDESDNFKLRIQMLINDINDYFESLKQQ